uniref:Uncharacterized protein n=1 Tax=Arundo donax TaxID=35708 RepID=A0A0A9C4I4_ARUDO
MSQYLTVNYFMVLVKLIICSILGPK